MRAVSDDGVTLDAEYQVEADGNHLALIMESRSGASGSRLPRNPDYNQALTILLSRLGSLNAVLADALVDSRQVHDMGLPEDKRKIIDEPVVLTRQVDMEALRRRMGNAQARIGQAPEATKGGNATKRIRLLLHVPGYQSDDAPRLAETLAARSATPVFILTWNPDRWGWPPDEYARAVQVTAAGGTWAGQWSVGIRRSGISPGDQAMLLRQRHDRGLIASGTFISGLYEDEHWDGTGRPALYGQINWDTVLEAEDRLPVEVLRQTVPSVPWDRIQGSGVAVPLPAIPLLGDLWTRHTGKLMFHSQDEPRGPGDRTYPEGALVRVEVNRYERDRRARKACLDHWGYHCAVCGFSFEDQYGSLGQDFIHVHHTLELSLVPTDYKVNPITDLRPVCPNCHAMLHRTSPALTVHELKQILHSQGNTRD